MRKLIFLLILSLTLPALAVQTSHWTASNESDFQQGKFHNVVVTNRGELKLSRATKTLLEEDPRVSAVYCLAEDADGTIYAGTGPQGVVLAIKDDKARELLKLDDNTNISALLVDSKGRLLIGTSGDKGKVLRLDPGAKKPVEIFSDDDVQYVWAIVQTPDGNLYVATGPKGQLFEVTPDGKKSVLLTSDEANLLSMVSDGKDLLYVGTDPNGLVYRINRKTKDSFVIYDAAESEVSALALDAQGNLYAGTSEANARAPDQADNSAPASTDKEGHPEDTTQVPLPSDKPKDPTPPAVPNPNPGQPTPIPKQAPDMYIGLPHRDPLVFDEDPGDGPDQPAPEPQKQPGIGAATMPAAPNPAGPTDDNQPHSNGNAIYRIDPDGFVTEIFRQNCMVLSMVEQDGVLIVGTGDEGLIYQVNPAADETLVLAKTDPKEVMSMLPTKDGRIILGLANVGGIVAMSSGYASDGTYASPALDATQVSRFGKIHLDGSLPAGTTLTVATRSGNIREAGKAGWSKWSEEQPATEYLPVTSPFARFLQYRLTFTSKTGTDSAMVNDIDVAYQIPNMAPVIKSVKVTSAAKAAAAAATGAGGSDTSDAGATAQSPDAHTDTIAWDASDPNGDDLSYSVYFRATSTTPWILLKDKVKDVQYAWDTRTVADGRYEVKVVASNAASNDPGQGKTASRISDPVIVDNTPPVIGDIKTLTKAGAITISARLVDATSTVADCEYSVDSSADWQTVLPSSNIYDSPEEDVSFSLTGLSPGDHQVALRATDSKGNRSYQNVVVTIPGSTTQP